MISDLPTRVAVRAQAKLNLWLHVLAKEASGYHSIETLFHRLELADDVLVRLDPAGMRTITCSEDVGPAAENIAYRAAQLYCEVANWQTGFHIDITKRIPVRGGLGGGSADAAATLLALDALSPHKHGDDELAEMGARLGADVPFLLANAPMALAWGHGDRILKLPALPQKHVALAIPDFGFSTRDVYQSFVPGERAQSRQLSSADLNNWDRIARQARNELTSAGAVTGAAALSRAIIALRGAGAIMAEMSGSGSIVFGIFDTAPDAAALKRSTGCDVVLTRTALAVEAVQLLA